MSRLSFAVITVLSCAALFPAAASADTGDQIIVKRAPGLSAGERAALRSDADVKLTRTLPIAGEEVVSAKPGDRPGALADLRSDRDVVWAEPVRDREIEAVPTDTYFGLEWGLRNTGQSVLGATGTAGDDIDALDAWRLTQGRGVTVAVVDTGVQLDDPELSIVPGHDWIDGDDVPADQHGHGTHVSGTIAAALNGSGVVGVAPRARIMPLRVLDASGHGSTANSAAAFAYAGDHGIEIVNASIGSTGYSQAEYDAIAAHPGTLYVVAAGNSGTDNDTTGEYPCDYDLPNIVCVGASDQDDQPADFSDYGATSVDLYAPGVSIVSTYSALSSDGVTRVPAYAWMDGTSMATPHVTGVAALLAARDPSLTVPQIKQAILAGVDTRASLTGLSVTGGRLDAARALATLGPDTTPPAAPSGVTATGGSRTVTLSWTAPADEDVAGYRVYPVLPTAGATPAASPTATRAVLSGLADGVRYGYEVTAVDAAGNESAPSPVAGAQTAAAPTPVVPTPPAPVPPRVVAPAPRATITRARLTGRVRLHGAAAHLSFSLGAASSMRVSLARRLCHGGCVYVKRGSRTLRLPAGRHTLAVRSGRLAGLRLRVGSWRVTLATSANTTRIRFRVTAR